MTTSIPEYVQAEGNVAVFWLPAAVSLSAITVAEFAAGTNLTPFLPDVWEGNGGDQNKGEQTRMSLKESFEILGKIKRSISDFTYTHLPQAQISDPANKARAALTEGSVGVIAVRFGPAADTAIAALQKYEAIRAKVGMGRNNTGGSDEFAPLTRTSSLSASGGLVEGVVAA